MRAGARPEAAVRQRGRPFFLVKGLCPFFPALPQAGRAIFFNTVLRSGGLYGRIVFLISQPDGRQPRSSYYGGAHAGRDFCQRLDRRAQRHCHLHHHPLPGGPEGHYYQRGLQLPGRAGDDPLQQLGGLHHQQHGGLWRRHPGGPYRPVRGAVFHCGFWAWPSPMA